MKHAGEAFRIGEYELCEPDYRCIAMLAKELGVEPDAAIRRWRMDVLQGRITKLMLMENIPATWLSTLSELAGLRDLRFALFEHAGECLDINDLPTLEVLQLMSCINLLPRVQLSHLPHLLTVYIEDVRPLEELRLSDVPNLTTLICRNTGPLSELDLSACPRLTHLSCDGNELTQLDLSKVPRLEELSCNGNKLTHLNLAQTPNLKSLHCRRNELVELDVRMLRKLQSLSYDSDRICPLQRLDQKF